MVDNNLKLSWLKTLSVLLIGMVVVNTAQMFVLFLDYELCSSMRRGVLLGLSDVDQSTFCQTMDKPLGLLSEHAGISMEAPVTLLRYGVELCLLLGLTILPVVLLRDGQKQWKNYAVISSLSALGIDVLRLKVLLAGDLKARYALIDVNFWGWSLLSTVLLFVLAWRLIYHPESESS